MGIQITDDKKLLKTNVSNLRNTIKHTLRHSYNPQYALAAYVG